MKKYLMAAVAFFCMTTTSVVFTSCSEEKSENKTERVYYQFDDSDLKYVTGHEDVVLDFMKELTSALQSISSETENNMINRIQAVVDRYDNQYIGGNLYLQRSTDATNYTTIKTFTMKFAE